MRLDRDEWALRLAEVTALRGTCLRRQVGCVLLDFDGKVLATGYNGVASGMEHCNESVVRVPGLRRELLADTPFACHGARLPTGTGLDLCEAVHAEQNALLQCANVRDIHACYTTVSPCIHCAKLLMNTGCRHIVFREEYAHPSAKELWIRHMGDIGIWRLMNGT